MIILIEPQCTGFAHEQFNAGFLYGYALAYPDEQIVFFGEKEHIKCIQTIFMSAGLTINNVGYTEVDIPRADEVPAIFDYFRIIKQLLSYAVQNRCNKIVFLSIHTYNLIPLKFILQMKYKNSIQVHIVMHGILETIKRKNILTLTDFFIKVMRRIRRFLRLANPEIQYKPQNRYLYEKIFERCLYWFSNENITFFVFRDDSLNKVRQYLPKLENQFKSIDLPYIYKAEIFNNFVTPIKPVIFATFEKGNVNELISIASKLVHKCPLEENFEMHIIGGKLDQNLAVYPPVKLVGTQGKLTREEIDDLIKNCRYLLFFYQENSYELTTSGLFFDAIAYCKPIIFLTNQCMNFYQDHYKFGYRCNNVDEMTLVMEKIIHGEDTQYLSFISEILRMQQDTSIRNNFQKLMFTKP